MVDVLLLFESLKKKGLVFVPCQTIADNVRTTPGLQVLEMSREAYLDRTGVPGLLYIEIRSLLATRRLLESFGPQI